MDLRFKFSVNPGELADAILDAVVAELQRIINSSLQPIARRVREEVQSAILSSPEYDSLLHGTLFHELGVADPASAATDIVRAIQEGVRVTPIPVRRAGRGVTGGLRVEVLKSDFSEVLGLSIASFTSEHNFDIPWLRWLLTEGDRIIIADYDFTPGFPERSRTGDGIMLSNKAVALSGGGWRVPPEFAGTESDNWLTRAFAGMESAVVNIITEEMSRRA